MQAQYTSMSKILHWLVAGLIVLQFVLASLAENADDAGLALRQLALLANHKSVGISILALAIVRLAWRLAVAPPDLPQTMVRWQLVAARVSHGLLYALIFLLPISGWLMSSASAFSVSWFNLVQLPDFVLPDPVLKEWLKGIHELLGKMLFVLACIHILAALKHHFIDKDPVLRRMTSPFSIALFVAVITAGVATLTTVAPVDGDDAAPEQDTGIAVPAPREAVIEAAVVAPTAPADLPIWQINHADSFIRFTADQAGASFDGAWQDWSAELRFDSERLEDSSFDVSIRSAAVSTGDAERDATLADPEWFDTARFPVAYYRAGRFTRLADGGFSADGELTIKGAATPVSLQFTVENIAGERVLLGTADLLRLELGVGTGEWQDTAWIADEVRVSVRVRAAVPEL